MAGSFIRLFEEEKSADEVAEGDAEWEDELIRQLSWH